MVIKSKQKITYVGEDVKKQELSHIVWEILQCKMVQPPWKTILQFLRK